MARAVQNGRSGHVPLEASKAFSMRRRMSSIRHNIVMKLPSDPEHRSPIIADRSVMGGHIETAEAGVLGRVHVLILRAVGSLVERDVPEPSARTLAAWSELRCP